MPRCGGPAAVLWDMDGTLVDTEPYWIATEYALAEKYGGTWSEEHALNLVGNALLESGDYIRVHMGIDRTPQQIVDELLDGVVERVEDEVPWRPGARELLDDLRAHGVPCALVTMSWQRFVEPDPRAPAGRRVRHRRDRRSGRVRQAAPRALPDRGCRAGRGDARTASRSRTPTPAPSPPWLPGASCSACPTTCRSWRGRVGFRRDPRRSGHGRPGAAGGGRLVRGKRTTRDLTVTTRCGPGHICRSRVNDDPDRIADGRTSDVPKTERGHMDHRSTGSSDPGQLRRQRA